MYKNLKKCLYSINNDMKKKSETNKNKKKKYEKT